MNFGNFIASVDTSLILFAALFILIFAFIKFALDKSIFKKNKGISVTIALVISILSIYGLAKTNFSFDIFLFNLGIGEELISMIAPWILLAIAMFIIFKWGFGPMLMIAGIVLVMAGITKLVYEYEFSVALGFAFLIIGLIMYVKMKKRKEKKLKENKEKQNPRKNKKRNRTLPERKERYKTREEEQARRRQRKMQIKEQRRIEKEKQNQIEEQRRNRIRENEEKKKNQEEQAKRNMQKRLGTLEKRKKRIAMEKAEGRRKENLIQENQQREEIEKEKK